MLFPREIIDVCKFNSWGFKSQKKKNYMKNNWHIVLEQIDAGKVEAIFIRS